MRRRPSTWIRPQANYLVNVLRLGDGDEVLVFNGADGEWRARLSAAGKKSWARDRSRGDAPADTAPRPPLPVRPAEHARLDYMVEKAVEMGGQGASAPC